MNVPFTPIAFLAPFFLLFHHLLHEVLVVSAAAASCLLLFLFYQPFLFPQIFICVFDGAIRCNRVPDAGFPRRWPFIVRRSLDVREE